MKVISLFYDKFNGDHCFNNDLTKNINLNNLKNNSDYTILKMMNQ